MRLSTAVFYAVVLISATFTLYFMVELTGNAHRSTNQEVSEDELTEVDHLEHKLRDVEASIRRNQNIVVSLQNSLSSLLKDQVPLLQDTIATKQKKRRRDKTLAPNADDEIGSIARNVFGVKKLVADESQCPAAQWKPLATDVQMLDVYDKLPFDNQDGGAWKQGWDITYDASQWTVQHPLLVFIVPHSHNDPGWLKTFEEYFKDQTKSILDLAVKKLPLHAKRKFIWAEISYLSLWWETASLESQATFKRLVKSGQIELVTGGWVMSDEANSHYFAIVDQLIEGHEWIKNHLGEHSIPKHGWSIDPFGVSPTIAYILKWMKFEGMLIQRAHYGIKKHLAQQKSLEFQWRQSWDQKGKSDIFCHLMPFYSYDVPHTCGPEPSVCCQFDFRRLPGAESRQFSCPWKIPPRAITTANVEERAETLLNQYRKKAQLFKTNVLFIPLGDDFRYDTAGEWDQQFINYEKLIKHINNRADYNTQISFGTLKDYFDAVKNEEAANSAITFPTLAGDFFTYADRDDHYWSGYYTSRPFYKSMERYLESRLRAAEVAFSLSLGQAERRKDQEKLTVSDQLLGMLVKARRSLGLFQHHDGITGTAKTAVMNDYALKMTNAVTGCNHVIARSLAYLMTSETDAAKQPRLQLQPDDIFESTDKIPKQMPVMIDEDGQKVIVYNPLGHTREELITMRVKISHVSVVNAETGHAVLSQISPVWDGTKDSIFPNEFELAFVASVPALGVRTFILEGPGSGETDTRGKHVAKIAKVDVFHKIAKVSSPSEYVPFIVEKLKYSSTVTLENDIYKLTFDGSTGYLKKIIYKETDVALDVGIKFIRYGTTSEPDKSGAYLFMPDGPAQDMEVGVDLPDWHPESSSESFSPLIRVIRGPVVSELQVVLLRVVHIVRVSHATGLDGQSPEIINYSDVTKTSNFEMAMHITAGIQNSDFVTDLNGFQLIRRKTHDKLPLQASYYPMPTLMYIEDDQYRLTIVSKQPLGAASLTKGAMEIMLDRRLDQDDNRGLGQAVHDNIPATKSVFRLVLEPNQPKGTSTTLRNAESHPTITLLAHMSLHSLLHPYILMTLGKTSVGTSAGMTFSGLPEDLPCDVHLLNLRTTVAKETEDGMVSLSLRTANESSGRASGATALMMLHRVGVDCRRPTSGLVCSFAAGKVDLKRSFKGILSFPYLEEGSPSPLHKGDLLPADAVVTLDAMHIHAYRFPLI